MKKIEKYIIDIETLPNCFILCGEDLYTDRKFHFIIWKNKNDLEKLYKFLEYCITNKVVHITFNGLAFDSQILHWLIVNKEDLKWEHPDEVINKIYNKAQECIKKTFGNEFQEFPEWKLSIPQIDIFKLNHWDNPAKMCSLKWLQCSMDWPNLEDMPYEHNHYVANEEELGIILSYCYNDVAATKKGYLLSKDGVELREALSKEYKLNLNSASEPRLAKELFLHFLSNKLGIEKKDLKKYYTIRDRIDVDKILLPYIKFERQEFVMLLNNFKKLTINGSELRGAFKYNVKYRGLSIDYGVGGIHGFSKEGKYFSDQKFIIMTSDVKSYYPNLAIQNKWSPAHISKVAFCDQYEAFYTDRTKYKKGTPKNYLYKILLNSTFGLSIDKNSFLSDPQLGCQITINGQLLLSMLLEMLCEGIPEAQPLVMNTDGLEMRIPVEKEPLYLEICKKWEDLTKLELEHDNYKSLFAFDCNNYLAVPFKGKTKCKGRFEFEPHDSYDTNVLHKNKSFIVVAKGVHEYFVNGTKPEEFVKNHKNIYDFCGFARAKGKWKFIQVTSTKNGIEEKPIQKTLRYYMSVTGSKVIKKTIDYLPPLENSSNQNQREVVRIIQVVAGRNHMTPFNKYEEKMFNISSDDSENGYNIDYNFYIKEIDKEIKTLERQQTELALFE